MGRRKKGSAKEQDVKEEIELSGAVGGLARMLEPGIGNNTISALNYIFMALFLCLLLMLLFAGAPFHYMILLGLACGLFLSVQYFLSEASKLKGVLDPSPEDLKRDPKAPYSVEEKKDTVKSSTKTEKMEEETIGKKENTTEEVPTSNSAKKRRRKKKKNTTAA